MAGGLVGVGIQAQWLAANRPCLNWTLPAAHTFNGPGWYHAVFLTAACTFLASAATSALMRMAAIQAGPGDAAHGGNWASFLCWRPARRSAGC